MGDEQGVARDYAARLAAAYGDDLRAVVLYGSAARGDYRAGVSDLNLLVVLRDAGAAALRRGAELAREWAESGNPPPLLMSEEEWRGSADVFPIEYSDIRDAHVLLHGDDPVAGIEVDWAHLRLQCEHELKSKKIRLREHYLLAARSPEETAKLLTASLPTFLTLFRTVLRLAGKTVPRDPNAVIDAVSALAGVEAEPFRAVQRARAEGAGARFAPAADDPVVTGYIDGVQRASHFLDTLTRPSLPGSPA